MVFGSSGIYRNVNCITYHYHGDLVEYCRYRDPLAQKSLRGVMLVLRGATSFKVRCRSIFPHVEFVEGSSDQHSLKRLWTSSLSESWQPTCSHCPKSWSLNLQIACRWHQRCSYHRIRAWRQVAGKFGIAPFSCLHWSTRSTSSTRTGSRDRPVRPLSRQRVRAKPRRTPSWEDHAWHAASLLWAAI